MEVLISIGILSIGLASVIALVPAGGNEARRALIEDRRAALGAAALADCINRGFLQPAMWDPAQAPSGPYQLVIDPLGGGSVFPSTMTRVDLVGMPPPQAADVFRGGDDLYYEKPEDEDAPAVPVYEPAGGPPTRRSNYGAFSWLATLLQAGNGNADQYRLSVVTFHQRPQDSAITGPVAATQPHTPRDVTITGFTLTREDFQDAFTKGSPVLLADSTGSHSPVWRSIVLPLPGNSGSVVTQAELMLDSPIPFTADQVYVYPGAVGVSEKLVTLEAPSPWSF